MTGRDVEAVRAQAAARRRWPRLPLLVSRTLFVGAILLLTHTVFPGVSWLGLLVEVYSTVVVPIDSGSFGLVGLMLILGGALARGKRIGWVFTILLFGIVWLADLLTVIVLVVDTLVDPGTLFDLTVFAQVAFNLASLGAIIATLIVYRAEFAAQRQPGNILRALATLITGLLVTFVVATTFVWLAPGGLAGPGGRIGWTIAQIVAAMAGGTSTETLSDNPPPQWITGVIGIMIASTLFSALLVLMRSQRRAAVMSPADEPRIRELIAADPEDSLAYFNTRRDKSVVFAADGRSAISYRVTLGVCLASADPLGPADCWPGAIRAWQDLIDTYGWTPAVIGASERGATAYDGAGLHVIRLGDEAVLELREFHLDSHDMRPVRQAVQRLERMGYRTRIRRHADFGHDELAALIDKTDAWRDTESERGFSMALGRLGDPADGGCLMVEALFPPDKTDLGPHGEVAGVLSLVPWGPDGLSLDVMRRSPRADNGVTELMVAHLMAAGRELRLRRVSLNFAMFRSAFEEGARIGAGPVLRLWRRLLLVASRWWQIESLFRANVKYRPQWRPRFLCYAETRDIALVGAASGVAEGFIDLPSFIDPAPDLLHGRITASPAVQPSEPPVVLPTRMSEPAARVPEQAGLRLAVRQRLLDAGLDPYPVSFRPRTTLAGLADLEREPGSTTSTAGRVLAVRNLGGVVFVALQDWTGTGQLVLSADVVGRDNLRRLRSTIDIGDHLGATGTVGRSRSGELSLLGTDWILTAKSLRPLPNPRSGLTDAEAKVRQRYLDLIMNGDARDRLRARSAVFASVRESLQGKGFVEVETPILQTVHGGANARPFRTHINAYDLELYLRIAPELYLKRLMVGGMDRIFEIGRNFRNEGADATHNPEFTMLEAYEAYGDYTTMRETTIALLRAAAQAATGGLVIHGTDHLGVRREVDLGEPFRVTTVNAALSIATGEEITADTEAPELRRIATGLGIAVDERWTRGNVLLELYEHLCESTTVAPTFFCDFPAEVSPLTRPHRDDPRLAERWDLVCFGAEIGTAYSELVDPVIQRRRLTDQSLQAAGGDPEAMELDEDFLTALEYAMPPTGGLGMGMDRLIMMLTGATIRQTIAFPLVRPRRRH